MPVTNGIEVYEILENGNLLNGIYTNGGLLIGGSYAVDNEVPRKIEANNLGVEGLYNCRFIETIPDPIIVTHCILEIVKRDGVVYEFNWTASGFGSRRYFKGLGLIVGKNHIAVSYC